MKHSILQKVSSLLTAAALLTANTPLLQQSAANTASAAALAAPIQDFTLGAVKMTDAYSANAFALEYDYLMSFDNERLLAGFRDNAGLSTNGAKRYGGWENTLIAGHSVGHYLSALAQTYRNASLTDAQRDAVYKKITALVDGLRVCQQNSKGKSGFLWAATVIDRNNVEIQFDNVERSKTNIIEEAWVPWYTMHKLIAGLYDVYRYTGYEPAKEVNSALGDWVYNRTSRWDDNTHNKVLAIEYGGMNDCMYDLYSITGKETHAIAAHAFDETALHELVLSGRADALNGRHANTTIPKFLGALKRYMVLDGQQLGGKTVDASAYLAYAEAFWEMVTARHTYITGGNSEWEHFGKDHVLDAERTNCNCETCNSYNMLKLSRELFKITGDKKYMDYYEQTYYNSILSSQNPESGMTTYFQPMATGYFKVYSSPFDHFWCCTGSGMESFSKLGDTVYMTAGNMLYVNLYQSSVLDWHEQGVTIAQESTIPDGSTAVFTVNGNAALDLRFRIPDWIASAMTVKVNGEKYSYSTVDGYAQVSREFKNGDRIELTLPQEVIAYSLPDNANAYGFKYGPIVLSAELGKENMQTGSTGMWVTIPKEKLVSTENITINEENGSVGMFMMNIGDYLVKDADALRFTLKGTNTNLTFTPHYRQYQQRYGIYWKFFSSGNAAEEELPRAKTTVTDTVQPGYGQYENDTLHNMQDKNSVGVTDDSTYRYAEAGGWFTYRMAIDPAAEMTILQFTLRRADNGKTLRVQVGDAILYAEMLAYEGDADIYNVKLIVPAEVIERNAEELTVDGTDYTAISVRFSADIKTEASARVCDFIYMTAVKPLYKYDTALAYFVDCGDHDTTTVSGSDKFGLYNSLTEQLYGEDKATGMLWGLMDDSNDQYNGASKSKGLYTANTWPDEYNTADGRDKSASYRYTKNQYESGIDRHLDYAFALPDGTYRVEMGFSNPWNCSDRPSVYADYGTENQVLLAENIEVAENGSATAQADVTVKNGRLTLNVRTEDLAINLSYIKIAFVDVPYPPVAEEETTEPLPGDVNCDGAVKVGDVILLNRFLAEDTEAQISEQGMRNAECDGLDGINGNDATAILRILAGL